MSLKLGSVAAPFAVRSLSPALRAWRDAADLVWARWELCADAGREERDAAFAAYVQALDSEDAAAEALARRCRRTSR